jgi:hypothetical protein
MTRMKSALLGATTLGLFITAGQASAQTVGASVVFLPAPPGAPTDSGSQSSGISADGRLVAGNVDDGVLANNIVVWINGVPRTVVVNQPTSSRPTPRGFNVRGISGDGRTIIGNEGDSEHRAVIWTEATGAIYFPNPMLGWNIVFDSYVNTDGTYFAAWGRVISALADGSGNPLLLTTRDKAYRYSISGGYQDLGTFGTSWNMRTSGISGDGNTIVGSSENAPSRSANPIEYAAFKWTASGGLTRLANLSTVPLTGSTSPYSIANGISRDGSTIVGASNGDDGFVQGVYWRGATVTGLGYIAGQRVPGTTTGIAIGATNALAANADGSVIVGVSYGAVNDLAWRWSAASGMQDLNLVARNASINLNGFILNDAVGVSDNGQFITGNASNGTQSFGYVLQLAQVTQSRLIVTLRGPGVTQTSIVNQTFSTQVDALLNGASVFTRTVVDPITGSTGVSALSDARAALQVGSGLRRVVIGAPTLVSNTTTVLSTTNTTVDVATGTTTTTASVNTFGPATVATGNLGTCATAAANNVAPTGCSLPGTPTTVDAGILNTNVFTNTINTVTPTTTPVINQLISAKWQISATAGNQFGTVHALVGPASFERSDRLMAQLLGMGSSGGGSASSSTSGIASLGATSASGTSVGDVRYFGGYYNLWSNLDADARVPVASVKGQVDGFVAGASKAVSPDLTVGVALDNGTSDYRVRDTLAPETLTQRQTQLAAFAGWTRGRVALSGAGAYGFGNVKTNLVTPTGNASANRDISSWSLAAQGAYKIPLGDTASLSLVAGARHASARLDPFTEVGGSSPLKGLSKNLDRTRAFIGLEGSAQWDVGGVTLTPRVYARSATDSGNFSGVADVVFASAPSGPTLQAYGPGVGKSVTEAGAGLDIAISDKATIWLGFDSQTRNGGDTQAAKLGASIAW